MRVTQLHVYPVKSARGVAVTRAAVHREGLAHDRRWMVVGPDGGKMSPPRHRGLLGVTATPGPDGSVTLTAAAGPAPLRVLPPVDGLDVAVTLSRVGTARDAGAAAADWLTAVLGSPSRLVWLNDPSRRTVSAQHGGRAGDVLSLADAGPLLLINAASLRQLERWSGVELAMARFRPNVVIDGDLPPFVEDEWDEVTIGSLTYRRSENCDRCVVTTLDPDTGHGGKEPIRTLARYRKHNGKVWFGVRLVPLSAGVISVDDQVQPPSAAA